MKPDYKLRDPSQVFSPGLVFYKDLIARNLANLVARVGNPERLRPHVKTHKTREIARMELEAGITKQKCATIAEAEMLAQCGVPDVLLSYPIVGPNCRRLAQLVRKFPASRFSTLFDHADGLAQLSQAFVEAGQTIDVLLDVDVGQHRTGIAPGPAAQQLYEQMARTPGLRPGGLHVYDGHTHQHAVEERQAAVEAQLRPVLEMRQALERAGLPVPRLVLGGTPTFPIYARLDIAGAECSPGTCVLNDYNYGNWFPDLGEFVPAALVLTRVISRPTPRRITFDLGYKAVASDPPAGKRCFLLDFPEHETVLQNEEHLVVETSAAERYRPGDVAYAMPAHICPTCALHQFAYVAEGGEIVGRWEIAARDRMLTV
jgi:D-serine deaminase-like pyridoxal phosphate-dependent protein